MNAAHSFDGALDAGDVTKLGVGVIIALVVIGALISLAITALIGRIVILAVVVVLAFVVWQQRSRVEDRVSGSDCRLSTTFFGVHVTAPQHVREQCQTLSR